MDTTVVKMIDGENFNRLEQKIIPCKFCTKGTTMLGTELCDPCYDLDYAILNSLEIAEALIAYYKRSQGGAATPTREELFNGG